MLQLFYRFIFYCLISDEPKKLEKVWKDELHFPQIVDSKKKRKKKCINFAITSKEWKKEQETKKQKEEDVERQKKLRKFKREIKKTIKLEELENKKKQVQIKKELSLKIKMEKEKAKNEKKKEQDKEKKAKDEKIALLVAEKAKTLNVPLNNERKALTNIMNK